MEDKKGSIIQFSFQQLSNIKRAFADSIGFQKKGEFHQPVKPEDEHKAMLNYNSINVVDVGLLKNQPIKSAEIPENSSLTNSIQQKIIELKNIFISNKEEEKDKQKDQDNNQKENKNKNYNDWQPM